LEAEGDAAFLSDDASRIQEHLALSPGPGARYRLVVMVDADRLTEAAANRLLKTLEEPPPSARILLSTSRVGAILPTVRSRLVRWHLAPPALQDSVAWLTQSLIASGQNAVGEAELTALLRRCALAPGIAWRVLQEGQAEARSDLKLLPPSANIAEMLNWAETVTRREGRSAAELLNQWELSLNQYYRQAITSGLKPDGGVLATTRRRDLLRQARRLARGARVPLNAQLLAESLALTSRL
jgi:DNA polymerase III delta prime subunit